MEPRPGRWSVRPCWWVWASVRTREARAAAATSRVRAPAAVRIARGVTPVPRACTAGCGVPVLARGDCIAISVSRPSWCAPRCAYVHPHTVSSCVATDHVQCGTPRSRTRACVLPTMGVPPSVCVREFARPDVCIFHISGAACGTMRSSSPHRGDRRSCCACSRRGLQHTALRPTGGAAKGGRSIGHLRGGCDDPETTATGPTTAPSAQGQAAVSVAAGEGGGGGGRGGGSESIRSGSSDSPRTFARSPGTEDGDGSATSARAEQTGEIAAAANLGASLVLAASDGDLEQVEKLLRQGARVNTLYIPRRQAGVKPSACTALHAAAQNGSDAVAQLLLRHGALVNARDGDAGTPLHRAAYWGRYEVIGTLIEHGADPAARDADGMTPLHNAAIHGKAQVLGGLVAAVRLCACVRASRASRACVGARVVCVCVCVCVRACVCVPHNVRVIAPAVLCASAAECMYVYVYVYVYAGTWTQKGCHGGLCGRGAGYASAPCQPVRARRDSGEDTGVQCVGKRAQCGQHHGAAQCSVVWAHANGGMGFACCMMDGLCLLVPSSRAVLCLVACVCCMCQMSHVSVACVACVVSVACVRAVLSHVSVCQSARGVEEGERENMKERRRRSERDGLNHMQSHGV